MNTKNTLEIDIEDVMRESFSGGKGVVCIQPNMPDAGLLAIIKKAASYGKPFTVVPAGEFTYIDGKADGDYKFIFAGADVSELAKLSADDAKTILANANTKIFLKPLN